MKTSYLMRRIIAGIVIGIVLMIVRKATAQNVAVVITSNSSVFEPPYQANARVRVMNPSGSSSSVKINQLPPGVTIATGVTLGWGTYGGFFTCPAGGFVDLQCGLLLSGQNKPGNYSGTANFGNVQILRSSAT